jgi:hypothetical protein
MGPMGAGYLKFIIYVPLVPMMHHIKFEKNWSSGYQEEVKNVQMLTETLYTVKYLYLEVGGTSKKLGDIRVFEISKIRCKFRFSWFYGYIYMYTSMHNICMLNSNIVGNKYM